MKLICAWCQQEGVPAFLCEVEPLDDPSETHGICARHRFEVLQELDTAQASASARGGSGNVADEILLQRWMGDSREMLETLLPALLAEGPNLARRVENAERTNRTLEARIATLREEVAAEQRERQQLNILHTEVADLVNGLVGRVAREVIQPLYDLMAKINRISVWTALVALVTAS
jgi:predicted RNase H-like nuclease (RuvC/YqgF family)